MKVLTINGSPEIHGCTDRALKEVEDILVQNGIEYVRVNVGKPDVRGCIACRTCRKNNKCIFDDIVNRTAPVFAECDGISLVHPHIMQVATASCWLSWTACSTPRPLTSTRP